MPSPSRQLSAQLNEWQATKPLQSSTGEPFFFTSGSEEERTASSLDQSGILQFKETRQGVIVQSTSFVGRIQLGELQITVSPKIDGLRLLKLLRYTYGLRDLQLYQPTGFSFAQEHFQEILIHQLHAEADNLLSRGLYRQYRRHSENLVSPHGRIDLNRFAAAGGVIVDSLPCIHYPRDINCQVNQVLLSGLLLAGQLARNLVLKTSIRRLAKVLSLEVSPVVLSGDVFRSIARSSNRLVAAYAPAFSLIQLLYEGCGIQVDEFVRLKFSGFLFDMNKFFQKLLSRFLRENLVGLAVRDEFGIEGMMRYGQGFNPRGKQAPRPRPDYAIFKNGGLYRLLDAKYRDLWNESLPREMLYQLSIYALSQEPGPKSSVVILYPTVETAVPEARIDIHDPLTGRPKACVCLRAVDLTFLAEIVSGFPMQPSSKRAAEVYAGSLVA